jgi:hypothetical protein
MPKEPNSAIQRIDPVIEDLIIREYETRRKYARDVKERGGTVGPFYGLAGTPTSGLPPRSE